MNIDVGQIIAGKYELVRLLGKGAMGEVWLATHNSLGGEFAIKLVEPADDVEAETAAGRFQLEAQIAAKLSRKTRHIVSVSDHGEENGLAYLVMELLEGESLEARSKRVGQLDLPQVVAIISQVARALSLAHEEGIFHRDLKPANVWLGRDEDGRLLVKLLDFGIARSMKPFRTRSPFATSKDMVLGTPSYMSPEQARGLETLDYRCDLWALAVVAYEALTRRIPFEGETVEDIFLSICTFRVVPALVRRNDLPPVIEAFFARAFAPRLDDRYGSALELTEAFEQLVTPEAFDAAMGTPISARRIGSNPNFGTFSNQANQAGYGRGSNPNFGSAPGFGGNMDFAGPTNFTGPSYVGHHPGYPGQAPGYDPNANPNPHASLARPGSNPNLGTYGGQGTSPGFTPQPPPVPARGSNPNFASNGDLASYANNGVPQAPSSDRSMYRGSSPDFENVALGSPLPPPRRNGIAGYIIAAALLIALLSVVGIVLVAFRGPSTNAGTQPETSSSTGASSLVLPPSAVPTTTTALSPIETAPAPSATAPTQAGRPKSTPPAIKPPAPTPQPAPQPSPPVTAQPTPPAPVPPHPTPAPQPAKTVNRSEVL